MRSRRNTFWCFLVAVLASHAAVAQERTLPSLAIFRLAAGAPLTQQQANLLTDDVVAEIKASGNLQQVITPSEADTRLGNVGQDQVRSCALDQCALVDLEIAGALGVTHLLVGNVTPLGTSWVVTLKIIELRSAREVASARALAEQEEKLPDTARIAARLALQQAAMARANVSASRDDGEPAPGKLAAFGVAGAGAVLGAVLLGGGLVAAGVIEGLVFTTWYVYPLPTPTTNVRDRVNALNGLTVVGALAGVGLGFAALLALSAAGISVIAGALL